MVHVKGVAQPCQHHDIGCKFSHRELEVVIKKTILTSEFDGRLFRLFCLTLYCALGNHYPTVQQ